jgi:hypothetical protein
MAFEQVRISDLRPGDLVVFNAEPPFDPEFGDQVIGYSAGVLRLRHRRTTEERSVPASELDLILRVRDAKPLEQRQVKDLNSGDVVLLHIGLPGNLGYLPVRMYEVRSFRDRKLSVRLAIDPADSPDALEDYFSEGAIEHDPEEFAYLNPPPEITPGVRFECPTYHQIDVPDREGHLVRVFVGPLPDGAPMPRAEFRRCQTVLQVRAGDRTTMRFGVCASEDCLSAAVIARRFQSLAIEELGPPIGRVEREVEAAWCWPCFAFWTDQLRTNARRGWGIGD